jgi:hypothetical protein
MRSALINVLWEIYKEKIDIECSFDDFLPVGEALLNDFEDIDKKNKNAKGIFKNVAELSEISKPNYLTEDEKKIIKRFFNFNDEKTSVMQNKIYEIYESFKKTNPEYEKTEEISDYEEVFDEEKNITFIQFTSRTAQINYALKQEKKDVTIILCDEKLLPAIPENLSVLTMNDVKNEIFDNIIFLSADDKIIPKTEPKPSFIPQHLRRYFELETLEDENKREYKLFFKLFNAAKNVSFCYTDMSCFLLQLSFLSPYKNKIVKIVESGEIKYETRKEEIFVEKTAEMLDKLKQKYRDKFLSPSALNIYIDCSLQFYFRYVAEIKKPDETELNPAILGNIFHKTMQIIYEKVGDSNYENLIEEELKPYSGGRQIFSKVISQMVKNTLDYDKKNAPSKILGLEKEHFFERDGIKIGGIIDRIDKIGKKIRIIDYKTGKIPDKNDFAKNIPDIFSCKRPSKAKYQFQIYLYSLILSENEKYKKCEISPNLLFVLQSEIEAKNFDCFSKEEFNEELTKKLKELFDLSFPFAQCENENICKYCDYCEICGR